MNHRLRHTPSLVPKLLMLLVCSLPLAHAQQPDGEQFFETRIRPILASQCYSCHTGARSGGLRLDSREAALKGGNSGAAIVPGKPAESLLIQSVKHSHERLKMPPGGKMKDEDAADLERWISNGAAWPKSNVPLVPAGAGYQITPEQRAFWSFQPVKDPAPPQVRDKRWTRNPVDAFISAKHGEKKLTPAAPASKLTLIRRATFDLTGLPPTPKDIDAFMADKSPGAFTKVIDRLLASREYGERWGRHWLDVVRYSDTAGDASDYPIPQAYLYRDYVIDSFNRDKPYDLFLKEQLAGDLMPSSSEPEKWERTIATGYLALSRRFNVDPRQNMHLTVDDTVDNLGKAVLGLSISCARCHDHKFDPIPNRDYYAIYGIFESTRYPYPGGEKSHRPADLIARNQAEADTILKPYLEEVYKITGRLGKVEGEKRAYVEGDPKRTMKDILNEIEELKKQRDPLLARMPKIDMAFAVKEGKPANTRIHKRGDHKDLGDEVPRGFLQIAGGKDLTNTTGSGRLELANWVTDPAHPLTARVMVNRIWQHHFGRGLVTTSSDFGKRGTPPTHPELLDYLAKRFIENGWSVKSMHRMLMTSETYQLGSDGDAANLELDGNNEFFWKYNRRRLDAESLRDSVLMISGALEPGPSGPHPFPHMGTWAFMQHGPFNAVYESNRRSVYLMTQRIQRHPYLSMFDGADASLSTAQRPLTITPIQGLFSMNSAFIHERAGAWADRLTQSSPQLSKQVNEAYRTALGRPATDEEIRRAARYLDDAGKKLTASGMPGDKASREAFASYLRALLGSNEFLFVE